MGFPKFWTRTPTPTPSPTTPTADEKAKYKTPALAQRRGTHRDGGDGEAARLLTGRDPYARPSYDCSLFAEMAVHRRSGLETSTVSTKKIRGFTLGVPYTFVYIREEASGRPKAEFMSILAERQRAGADAPASLRWRKSGSSWWWSATHSSACSPSPWPSAA